MVLMNNLTEDTINNKASIINNSINNDTLQINNDSEEEDVTFLICGGNEEYNLKDFSNINNGNNSSVSVSELLSNNEQKNGEHIQNEQSQHYNQHINNINNNMIYIENEDTTFEENPCKDMLMIWDVNQESRPWSRLLDVSPWFNYGFTEKTFKEYIIRQLGIRWERIKKQNIETSDDFLNKSSNINVSNNNNSNNNSSINDVNNNNNNISSNNMIMMNNNHNILGNSLTNYTSNVIYYPPHIGSSHVGHPNIYQQHVYNNYLPPPIMHHTILPPSGLNNSGNLGYNMLRSKKRPQE